MDTRDRDPHGGACKDGMLYVQAGAGIVHDSVPETRMAGDAEQGARGAARRRNGAARSRRERERGRRGIAGVDARKRRIIIVRPQELQVQVIPAARQSAARVHARVDSARHFHSVELARALLRRTRIQAEGSHGQNPNTCRPRARSCASQLRIPDPIDLLLRGRRASACRRHSTRRARARPARRWARCIRSSSRSTRASAGAPGTSSIPISRSPRSMRPRAST